jgi:hypothetical protein
VKDVGGILIVVVPALWLAWVSIRVIRSPNDAWARRQSRWMAVWPLWEGERAAGGNELRSWAVVWLVIAAAWLAFGLASGLSP